MHGAVIAGGRVTELVDGSSGEAEVPVPGVAEAGALTTKCVAAGPLPMKSPKATGALPRTLTAAITVLPAVW